jgi:PAS domain S-box-containing protein
MLKSRVSTFKSFGVIAIFAFLLIILFVHFAVSVSYRKSHVFEPPLLLPILNFLFLGLTSLVISYLAAKSYLKSGVISIALLGSGTLAFGITGVFSGWFINLSNGINITVTIFNCGALLSGILHFTSSIFHIMDNSPEEDPIRRRRNLILSYNSVVVLMAALMLAANRNWVPLFFLQGSGPTMLRQLVLFAAIMLLAISGIYMFLIYKRSKSEFFFWYALGLILIAEGLFGVALSINVGGIINWTGRLAQYTGGIFLLLAVINSMKKKSVQDVLFEVFRSTSKLYESIFENSLNGIIISIYKGPIIAANPSACQMLGLPQGKIQNMKLEAFFDRNDPDYLEFRSVIAAEGSARAELNLKDAFGNSIAISLSAAIFTDKAGKKIEYINFSDISERKRIGKNLRESEALYRAIAQNFPNGAIFVFDQNLRFRIADGAAMKALGYTRETLEGKTIWEALDEDTCRKLEQRYPRVLAGETFHLETLYKGRYFSFSYVPIRDDLDEIIAGMVVSTDVTNHKHSEQAIKKSEQLLRDVLDNTIASIGLLEADGTLVMSNRASLEIADLHIGDVKGKLFEDCYWWEWNPKAREKLRLAIKEALSGNAIRYDEVIRVGENRFKSIDFMLSPIMDKGTARFLIPSAVDITERKNLENELKTAIEFLHIMNESKTTTDLITRTIDFFWGKVCCDAVGIRLAKEQGYPYFETRGFPEDFVRKENELCSRNEKGDLYLDSKGNPILECMCGTVICGRFDPSKPFFTDQGSFFTGSTSELLAQTTEDDRQGHTRNRCNGQGYESVVLIPLISGDERLGLIQFNDKRKHFFSQESVKMCERLANYLSISLSKLSAEESLQQINQTLETQVAERTYIATERARQLQTLAVELIESEERERRQFAHLLHEDLQQMLASAKMHLQSLPNDLQNESSITEVQKILYESIIKLRNLSHELSPPILQHSSLSASLQWLCSRMEERFGLKVRMITEIEHQIDSLPLKTFIFRSVQELLFNTFKHSGTLQADLILSGTRGTISVTVGDNGKGFQVDLIALCRMYTD